MVALSLLSRYDTGLDNNDNEVIVVGARHIFPVHILLKFYLFNFNTVFFSKETTDHNQFFPRAYGGY